MPVSLRWQRRLERWRSAFAGVFHSQSSPGRPRLCPSCGTLVGATATKCHQCGTSLTFSLAAASRSLSHLVPAASPVTHGILWLCGMLYVICLLASFRLGAVLLPQGGIQGLFSIGAIDARVLNHLGGSLPFWFDIRQPWRFVTAVFLHGSLLHIAFNMWVLMDFGPHVEEQYGSARYLFLYIVTGTAGYAVSALAGHASVGASGALMGLIGVLLAITMGRRSIGAQMMRSYLIRFLIYVAVFGLMFRAVGVDNAAHMGGLAAGFLLGRVMADREPATASERTRAYALGWLAGLVVVASFAAMLMHYFRSTGSVA